jgi:hypothetical protein
MQEHLRKRWHINGDTMSIGFTGSILSAQHRLISLILACQAWEKEPEKYPDWVSKPTMDCIIVFGINEADEVVNTIDTGKSRSLADVLYRSEILTGMTMKDRKEIAYILAFAVSWVWARTGVKEAFGIEKSHSETVDFLARHPKILECAKHIWEENGGPGKEGKRIMKHLKSLGMAAGFMYLMAASKTEWEGYAKNRDEKSVDLSLFDEASTFFTELANNSRKFFQLRESFRRLSHEGGGSTNEYIGVLVKAWRLFVDKKQFTEENLQLAYKETEDGELKLIEFPRIGGIDIGPEESPEEEDSTNPEEALETPSKPPKRATGDLQPGEKVYVREDNGAHWFGILKAINKGKIVTGTVQADKRFAGGGEHKVPIAKLQRNEPDDETE